MNNGMASVLGAHQAFAEEQRKAQDLQDEFPPGVLGSGKPFQQYSSRNVYCLGETMGGDGNNIWLERSY